MVTACKSYITEDGLVKVWEQPRKEVIGKLLNCTRLYQEYKEAFRRTKEKTETTPGERAFEFSEMYIFGKFDTFCKRLEKVSRINILPYQLNNCICIGANIV